MSRASGASFAQFFPSAPRAAKDKAKEREKSKSLNLESPSIPPVADNQVASSDSRIEDGGSTHRAGDSNIPVTDTAPPAEDNESIPGDILNGVGSASSHTSTISSVFSGPTQSNNMSTVGGTRNISSLTPLTNTDSSPSRITSPDQHKSGGPATNSTGFAANKAVLQDVVHQSQPSIINQTPSDSRVYARDPNRSVKGTKCIYDPQIDSKSSSIDKKKKDPKYKEFGLVRIQSAGSVILLVRMSG